MEFGTNENLNQVHTSSSTPPFVGRTAVFTWIRDQVGSPKPVKAPLIIRGPRQMGKTALLQQIAQGALGEDLVPIYFNLQELAAHSLSALFWDLAHISLNRLKMDAELDQTAFMADPFASFVAAILKPGLAQINAQKRPSRPPRRLLFLADNLQALLPNIEAENLDKQIINALHHFFSEENGAAILFSLDPEPFSVENIDQLVPAAITYQLPPLQPEESVALVNQLLPMIIVDDVAAHIHAISRGKPQLIKEICRNISETCSENQILTVVDVTAACKKDPQLQSLFHPPPPTYSLKTLHPYASLIWWNRRVYTSIAAVTLLLLLFLLWPVISTRPFGQRVSAIFIPPTPTVTPSPPPPTSTPTRFMTSTPVPVLVTVLTPTPMDTATTTPSPTPTLTPSPTITPSPTPQQYPLQIIRDKDGMEMVLVAAGNFKMGASAQDFVAAFDEKPAHTVVLNQFYIDKYEVTVEQYAAFLNHLGTYIRACDLVDCVHPRNLAGYTSYLLEEDLGDGTVQYFPITGFARYPINHVSWYGANNYCEYVGGRLPTEAEWEYAARGDDDRIYPWGNQSPNGTLATFESASYENLKPVDALEDGRSPFGVFNMAGSMWEWTADWYSETYYQESPPLNPTGPETGFGRVLRGGAWPFNNHADRIRATNRSSLTPEFISSAVGFRCVYEP